jgi:ABC-type antimicrobial peptide transport system permease subunit
MSASSLTPRPTWRPTTVLAPSSRARTSCVTQALSQYDVGLSIPASELVLFTIVAILAGVAAAVVPARRAARLNVLDALHYE